jgi:hypothetical protein
LKLLLEHLDNNSDCSKIEAHMLELDASPPHPSSIEPRLALRSMPPNESVEVGSSWSNLSRN